MTIDFDPYAKSFAEDPYPVYAQLRDEAPVYHQEALNFWAISRYADVLEAHRDFGTFSSAGGVTIEGMDGFAPLLIVKDPPEHRWHKALVTKVFTPARMGALEGFIRDLVVELLDRAAEKDEFDFVQEFALQVPLQVISELIGIPPELRDEIHRLTNASLNRDNGYDQMAANTMQSLAIYKELVVERRAKPREDPISYLIEAEVRDEDGAMHKLTDDEMAWRFGELAAAGHETVAKAIPNGAMAFQRFPAERDKLRASLDPKLLNSMVDEVLRFDPPSQLQGRTTTREVELHGVTIPAGVKTMLLTGAATRDPRRFDDPDRFDISRQAPVEAVYFGFGAHRCLGIHLARLELRIVFEELFRRFPDFEVDPSRATRSVLSNVRGVNMLPARLAA